MLKQLVISHFSNCFKQVSKLQFIPSECDAVIEFALKANSTKSVNARHIIIFTKNAEPNTTFIKTPRLFDALL